MLSIKNNMMAENAARHLGASYNSLSKSVERLSSGQRINSAKDDAAGLAVRELIRADVAQLRQASRNAQDAVSMLQTAEGAMAVMDDILVRMKELAEQASTESYSDAQIQIMHDEFEQLSTEITRIATSTKFNDKKLLDNITAYSFHLGEGTIGISGRDMSASGLGVGTTNVSTSTALSEKVVASASDLFLAADDITADTNDLLTFDFGTDDSIAVDLDAYDDDGITLNDLVNVLNAQAATTWGGNPVFAKAEYDADFGGYRLRVTAKTAGAGNNLTVGVGTPVALATADFAVTNGSDGAAGIDLTSDATGALTAVTTAIGLKDAFRAELGYIMNRLEAANSILDIQAENLAVAESRISDADVATEMAAMTRNQVLSQAGISMLAQANSMPQMALKLLG